MKLPAWSQRTSALILVASAIVILVSISVMVAVWSHGPASPTGTGHGSPIALGSEPEPTPSTVDSPSATPTATLATTTRPSASPPKVTAPATPGQLLANGDFGNGITTPWWTMGKAPITVENGRLRAMVDGSGTTNAWDVMVAHDFVPLTSGYSYVLSFDASASISRDIGVTVQMGPAPYTNAVWELSSLGTATKHFSYSFTSKVTADWGSVNFQLGNNGSYTLWLDNVVLTRTN